MEMFGARNYHKVNPSGLKQIFAAYVSVSTQFSGCMKKVFDQRQRTGNLLDWH